MNTELLYKVNTFAHADEDIRVVILEGSFAVNSQVDELSDYDINIHTRNAEKYLSDDQWLNQIGEVLLYQKEQFQFYDDVIPTRLVLFRDRERIDFSFWRLGIIDEIVRGEKIYESYKNGYQVLVDKDHLAGQLPSSDSTGFALSPPNRDRFLQIIYNFWFEAYSVARSLARKDLWYAKLIESRYVKDQFYQMALWDHQSGNAWKQNNSLHTGGKHFEHWASEELISEVSRCFSQFDVAESWRSLFKIFELFNQLARETSIRLQIEYPVQVEADILSYLRYLQNRPDNRDGKSC